ncbi:9406_t:CDS:1, partial [Diversispora eburnea]
MDKTKKEQDILMSQLYKYQKRLAPFDISFINNELPQVWWISIEDFFVKNEDHICQLTMKLFAITPHAAGYEIIWLRLEWYYRKRRTSLSLDKLENMQKLAAFYIPNIKKELPYYGNSKVTEELQKI